MEKQILVPKELADIIEDLVRHYKYAINKHPSFPESLIEQAALVCEEAGEAIREANNQNKGLMKHEMKQTIAVALRVLVANYE